MARFQPRKAKRVRRSPILILCEGSQTEPNYLSALIRELGLTSCSVPRNNNTDPLAIVQECIRALRIDASLAKAFAVFDRDEHAKFDEAVNLAVNSPYFGDRLHLVRSYPSFELWLLHHFESCTAPKTAEQVLARLKVVYPAYDKGSARCMDHIVTLLTHGIRNSRAAYAAAHHAGADNPSSEMHLLVAELIKMIDA